MQSATHAILIAQNIVIKIFVRCVALALSIFAPNINAGLLDLTAGCRLIMEFVFVQALLPLMLLK